MDNSYPSDQPVVTADQVTAYPIQEFQTVKTALVSSAHLINDTYSGFIAPLLPFLIMRFALLKVEASLFLFLYQGISIFQPIIGNWADRVNLRKIALLAPAVSGIFLCLLGSASSYQTALLFCLLAGISSASLHAILPPMVSSYSGKNIGKGMSFWMVGGELGVMAGPLIVTAFLVTSHITEARWLMIGGLLISLLLIFQLKDEPFTPSENKDGARIPTVRLFAVMFPLGCILLMRSLMQAAVETYLPVYLLESGANAWLAGASISILEGFGVLGVIIGGLVNDRYGFKPGLLISIVVSGFATLAFVFTGSVLKIACLAILGTATMMVLPIGMAITQEYFPSNRSLANGLFLAILFAVNASMSVVSGYMYDQIGGTMTYAISGAAVFLAVPFILTLPKQEKAPTI